MKEEFISCNLCPRSCNINRYTTKGFCKAPAKIKIARVHRHMFEEPCLTGKYGSGTIFFSHCNLNCIFCQNEEISHQGIGKEVSIEEFANLCIRLQNEKATNINLVTPTFYVPLIKDGLKLAKEKGLNIPIVYNTSGYEKVETLKMLEGLIDIYLPDFKYYDDLYAKKFSNVKDYSKYAKLAINEMVRQTKKPKFKNNILKKGVIVRILVLPKLSFDAKKIIKYLHKTYKDDIYISIMNQYTPMKKTIYENLNHKLENKEYQNIIEYAIKLDIKNAYIQEEGTQEKSFIPDFKNPNF